MKNNYCYLTLAHSDGTSFKRSKKSISFRSVFLAMLFINAKALFMRFYVLSMNFVSMCLNIVLSHAFSK